MTVWLAVALGLLVGAVMGTLGGGGALITVPLLVYVFAQPPEVATTASLIIVGLGALAGMLSHARSGRLRPAEGAAFAVVGSLGSVAGALAATVVPGRALLLGYAALLLAVAVVLLRGRGRADAGSPRRPWPVVALTATGVGLLTGFFGVGGGFAVVPALVLVLGFTMPEAVGTSLLVIAFNCAVALLTRAVQGLPAVDWPLVGGFSAAAVAGTLLGARLGGRLAPHAVQAAFAGLLIALAAFLLLENIAGLV